VIYNFLLSELLFFFRTQRRGDAEFFLSLPVWRLRDLVGTLRAASVLCASAFIFNAHRKQNYRLLFLFLERRDAETQSFFFPFLFGDSETL